MRYSNVTSVLHPVNLILSVLLTLLLFSSICSADDWVRDESNPVLAGYDPAVLKTGAGYLMWYSLYSGGHHQIYLSTSPDGKQWSSGVASLTVGAGWESNAVVPGAVVLDGVTYRMWYSGHEGSHYTIGHATSQDGINWANRQQVLALGAPGEFDDHDAYHPVVIIDDTAPATERYRMWYTGRNALTAVDEIMYATSGNGITWTKHGVQAVSSGLAWDSYTVFDPWVTYSNGMYRLWYSGSEGYHQEFRIGYATSSNGINWQNQGIALDVGEPGLWDDFRVNGPCVVPGSIDEMWYTNGSAVGYATSVSYVDVHVDVRPGTDQNHVSLKSRGKLPVAVLSTTTFDASQVDGTSVTFGPGQAVPTDECITDADGDGFLDWLAHFRVQECGFDAGSTTASHSGQTNDGTSFGGTDSIAIVPGHAKSAPAIVADAKQIVLWASIKAK